MMDLLDNLDLLDYLDFTKTLIFPACPVSPVCPAYRGTFSLNSKYALIWESYFPLVNSAMVSKWEVWGKRSKTCKSAS